MMRALSSSRIAYATAAASLPPSAANHVTLLTHWRSFVFVVSSAQRYSTWQLNDIYYDGVFSVTMMPINPNSCVISRQRQTSSTKQRRVLEVVLPD